MHELKILCTFSSTWCSECVTSCNWLSISTGTREYMSEYFILRLSMMCCTTAFWVHNWLWTSWNNRDRVCVWMLGTRKTKTIRVKWWWWNDACKEKEKEKDNDEKKWYWVRRSFAFMAIKKNLMIISEKSLKNYRRTSNSPEHFSFTTTLFRI